MSLTPANHVCRHVVQSFSFACGGAMSSTARVLAAGNDNMTHMLDLQG